MRYGEDYEGRKFETVYAGCGNPPEDVVDGIRAAGKRLDDEGLSPQNAGNISVRAREGMYITVGGVNKGRLSPEDVVEVVEFDFQCAKVVGAKEPSSETPMHWLIYQAFPDAKAIVHAHDDLAVDFADKLKDRLGIETTMTKTHYGTPEQAYETVEALSHAQYAVIREHGVVCIGETLQECLHLMLNIHKALKAGNINR